MKVILPFLAEMRTLFHATMETRITGTRWTTHATKGRRKHRGVGSNASVAEGADAAAWFHTIGVVALMFSDASHLLWAS